MTHEAEDQTKAQERAVLSAPCGGSLSAEQRQMVLASPLFHGVPYAAVYDWLHHTPVYALAPGDVLIKSGVAHGKLFVLVSGQLSIWLDPVAGLAMAQDMSHITSRPEVARILPGQTLGEQGLVDGGLPTVWAIAAEHSSVLVVPAEMAWQAMKAEPKIAFNLLRLLSARVRQANDGLRGALDHQQRLARDAETDALTGLHNRRWMDSAFARILQRHQTPRNPVSVLMIDIDHFKRVNDVHGHHVGDQVLCRAARRVELALRPGDLCARYGGEEFCVLLPEVDAQSAVRIAQRICASVAQEPFCLDSGIRLPVTVSIGVAEWDHHAPLESLVRLADGALYQAKHQGRNRVVSAAGVVGQASGSDVS
jgi:diguanylate cyclase (GGDEF)-like protein